MIESRLTPTAQLFEKSIVEQATLVASVWNPKGGVAKTTTAIQFAAACHARWPELKIVIVDVDAQGGSMIFFRIAQQRIAEAKAKGKPVEELGFTVVETLTEAADIVIYDHAPGLSANVPTADFVLMPITLDLGSIAAGLRGAMEVVKRGKSLLAIPCKFHKWADQMHWLAKLFGPEVSTVRNAAIYQRTYTRGKTVYSDGAGGSADLAIEDFEAVLDAVEEHANSGRQVSPPLLAKAVRGLITGDVSIDDLLEAGAAPGVPKTKPKARKGEESEGAKAASETKRARDEQSQAASTKATAARSGASARRPKKALAAAGEEQNGEE